MMYEQSAQWYDAIYSFKDYAGEAERIHGFIRRYKRSPGKKLLDVACGTGMHLYFLKERYDVEGLDINPRILAIAVERLPGVQLHREDMLSFDLGRRFDVVICLFSSIGYARTWERLVEAICGIEAHLERGGLLLVEPWFTPETYQPGTVHGAFVDQPDLKLARINVSEVEDGVSVMDMHHLVGTPEGVVHFVERHELGLFTHEQYLDALNHAGLSAHYDPEGLTGRGLYLGIRGDGES
jgi:SAM-dependent methyltransferase